MAVRLGRLGMRQLSVSHTCWMFINNTNGTAPMNSCVRVFAFQVQPERKLDRLCAAIPGNSWLGGGGGALCFFPLAFLLFGLLGTKHLTGIGLSTVAVRQRQQSQVPFFLHIKCKRTLFRWSPSFLMFSRWGRQRQRRRKWEGGAFVHQTGTGLRSR